MTQQEREMIESREPSQRQALGNAPDLYLRIA